MRKIVLALTPVLLAVSGPAAAQVSQWRISEATGDVRIVENGRSRAATRGALLSSGSTIATAARARAVMVRGQEFVVVSPGTQLRIPEQPQRGGIIQVLADWGTALFRIERRATPHFGVQTPYLAAVVKGTTFTVNVGRHGATVQVTEGAVEVSTVDGGAAELVRPGMIASVAASDLYQLNIDGETSRSIRSSGAPTAGVVTVPAPAQGAYAGPAEVQNVVVVAVREDPVPLAEATEGLLTGPAATDTVLANVIDATRRDGTAITSPSLTPAPAPAQALVTSPPPVSASVTPAPVTSVPTPPAPVSPPPVEPLPVTPPPVEPLPVTPPPVEPLPVSPPPVEPSALEPPPVEPLPVEPLPVTPPPVEPLPVTPPPVEPLPVSPPPVEPSPVEPPPVEPLPVEPPPVEPPPVEPPPVEPPPVEPPPVEPLPVEPPPEEDAGLDICLPGDLLCIGIGGDIAPDSDTAPGSDTATEPDSGGGGGEICVLFVCVGPDR